MSAAAEVRERLVRWIEEHIGKVPGTSKDMNSLSREGQSIRWLAVLLGLMLFSYEAIMPLVNSQRSLYMDLRFGLIVWLFVAAMLHMPMMPTELEDYPSLPFISFFILLLVVTHITLAAFTMLHHLICWMLQLCFPQIAEFLWVPGLRSVRSFKVILKGSILLSASVSLVFAYCGTMPETSSTECIVDSTTSRELQGDDANASEGANSCRTGNMVPLEGMIHDMTSMVCRRIMPELDVLWGQIGDDGTFNFSVLGIDLGQFSLLESPVGLLWLSGVAIWATYYTLRRTKRINQTLQRRARKRRLEKELKEAGADADTDTDGEAEDDNQQPAEEGSADADSANNSPRSSEDAKKSGTKAKTKKNDKKRSKKLIEEALEKEKNIEDALEDELSDGEYEEYEEVIARGLASDTKRRKREAAPTNFMPMAEWYSLALTRTAFDLLISMKLFLGRFDMRVMQAAIGDGPSTLRGNEMPPSHFSTRNNRTPGSIDEDGAFGFDDDGYTTANSSRRGVRDGKQACADSKASHKSQCQPGEPIVDDRYADMDELWFDWLADTGDGGNSTYAVARAVAQPSLTVPLNSSLNADIEADKSADESTKDKKNQPTPVKTLKRGDLLILGGDLAYPTPSLEEYASRLFLPFEYAMEPPISYHRDDISLAKNIHEDTLFSSRLSLLGSQGIQPTAYSLPATRERSMSNENLHKSARGSPLGSLSPASPLSGGVLRQQSEIFQLGELSEASTSTMGGSQRSLLRNTRSSTSDCSEENSDEDSSKRMWKGPPCAYAIPGNHDWFDGLGTFMQCICYRDWFGGWRLPQTKSYFALKLSHGWWVFGLDFALEDDIDGLQYQYFASVAHHCLGDHDQVILCSHEPTWVLDAYLNDPHPEDQPISRTSKNLKQLMRRHLRGRVAMRIAGDVHNYMRHDAEEPLRESALRAGAAPHVIVSGGGGAFLHPTHPFPERFKETGAYYNLQSAYPTFSESRMIGMKNLGQGFRMQNWKFDIVGSTAYFLMICSFFPRCNLDHIIKAPRFYPEGLHAFGSEILLVFGELFSDAVVSLIATIGIFIVSFSFADYHYGLFRQVIIATVHTLAHVFCAVSLFLLLEIVAELSIQDGLAGRGYDSIFEMFQSFERRTMPEAWWTTGLLETSLRSILRVFDLPENMATTRVQVCQGKVPRPGDSCPLPSLDSLSRFDIFSYYLGNYLYMYIVAADLCAMIFGLYLYICVTFFKLHWNEAFSAIRCEDYKTFMRFHIDTNGDLHVYVLGIDRVPRKWRDDARWTSTWSRLLSKHLTSGKSSIDEFDPSVASFGAEFPSRWIPAYTRNRKHRKKQEPRIVDYFCIPKKKRWTKLRRGQSTIAKRDWWEPFDNLEQRKFIRRVPSMAVS